MRIYLSVYLSISLLAFPSVAEPALSKLYLNDNSSILNKQTNIFAEIKKEEALIKHHQSIRGYSRQGDIDDAKTPSFPVYSVWERMSPNIDADESDNEQGGRKTSLSRLSDFSDLGLPRIFAEIQVWRPSENAKLLPSRRKNTLLYSRMYPWHPKPVTYHNFFLPQIEK